jgi:hypothetical protein
MSDSLNCGDGWVFCSKKEAEAWYDFYARRWKLISAAGQHGDCAAYRKRDFTPKMIKLEAHRYGDGYVAHLYWNNCIKDEYNPKTKTYRLSHHAVDILEAIEEVLISFAREEERNVKSLEGSFQDGIFSLRY